jgi:hypothetical protein
MDDNEEKKTPVDEARINAGYPVFQIAKALRTSEEHDDPETRRRAKSKISKWAKVLRGMISGGVQVGSRTPVKDVPGWATLEVVTGGFATGRLLAGGPLLDHERKLLAGLAEVSDSDARRVLNGYFVTDKGLADLQERLRSGKFDIMVPEEGALLVVAWLVENGYVDQSRSLLDRLVPYLPQLRFYPVPTERSHRSDGRVFLQDSGKTIEDLSKIKPKQSILAQKEAIQTWIPLYDQAVRLFLETVVGDPPSLLRDADGKRVPVRDGKFPVSGGWPCQQYPVDWAARARSVLAEYDRQRSDHKLCGKPERAKDSFAQLRHHLGRCIEDARSLSGREVGRIRLILARYVSKRGEPDSAEWRRIREQQANQAGGPTFHQIAELLISRLEVFPKDEGIDDLATATQPATVEESQRWRIPVGTDVPASLQRKVRRCLSGTIESLVDLGIITSGETLARVIPRVISGLLAARITDPALGCVYERIYQAFRRRRSLLLLNLENQIKIEELPWIASIDRFRHDDASSRSRAKQALQEITSLAIRSFPQTIIPNKLLQEMRALAKEADLDLPLVDEVAADIFMGQFSPKFVQAAKRAADLLEGTLYETYFGIDYHGTVRPLPEADKSEKLLARSQSRDELADLCASRAGVSRTRWDPATNGMIIEQQQILTSQNLAVLLNGLDLVEPMRAEMPRLARDCFEWICRRHQMKVDRWHARLIGVKKIAYGWRQMLFFLALLPPDEIRVFLKWAEEHLSKQEQDFRVRFHTALRGLAVAAEGRSLDDRPAVEQEARRLLGWSKERHWLLS